MLAIDPKDAQIINEKEAHILEYESDPAPMTLAPVSESRAPEKNGPAVGERRGQVCRFLGREGDNRPGNDEEIVDKDQARH